MLDLWNNLIKGDERDFVDEILQGQSQPSELYLKSAGLLYDLNIMAQEAIDYKNSTICLVRITKIVT